MNYANINSSLINGKFKVYLFIYFEFLVQRVAAYDRIL